MTQSQILIFFAGFFLGAALACAWFLRDTWPMLAPAPAPSATLTMSANMLPTPSGDVSVSNQKAGVTVLVDSVTVPPPGVWIAVEEMNSDGTLGNVLGAARVRGPLSNVTVDLLRPTAPGGHYALVLYRDDGSNTFDLSKDSIYVDFDTGEAVETPFSTF